MKNYKYIFSLVALIVTLQSCESYLEEINPNGVSTDNYWKDLTESNENLTSVYNGLLNQYIWGIDNEALRSDIGFPKSRTNPVSYGYEWHSQKFDNTGTHYFKSWNGMYRVIWRANQVIAGLNNMGDQFKSEESWTTQMGEARFLRGLMHFYLHSIYNNGQIIIRDEAPENLEEFSKPLSTSEEAITFFRDDLKYAYDNLPAIQPQKTRISKGTAALVLGKSYLYTKEYDLAMPLLNDVITGPYGYSLLEGDNVKLLFTQDGDYNSESILELNYTEVHQRLVQNKDEWDEEAYTNRWARYTAPASPFGGGGANYFLPTSWLTFAYSNEVKDTNDSRNKKEDGVTSISVPLRCAQMIAVVNDEESTYYQSKPGYEKVPFGGTTFSYFKKLTNHDRLTSEDNNAIGSSWASGKNVVIYRLSDAYLMYAECLLETGDLQGAIDNINVIRKRWGLESLVLNDESLFIDYTSGAAESTDYETKLRDHLRHVERPLELCLEGNGERAIDLRRWNVTKKRFQYLSDSEYRVVDYNFTKEDGTTGKGSLIEKGETLVANSNLNIEFDEAAVNFIEELHAYLPLPNDEILYNQEVD
ncbi:hypothetical protein GCM10022291_04400 [Postechiella marina]|uniref:RagB/SusD family nutrient uptake outer membrane protein n=1 Tax=Postechiella marina TaxID=943941 RepID=A0ABP8C0M8_9FLAO